MGDDIDAAILAGKNAEHMFNELERLSKQVEENSAAIKGIKRLHAIKPSLEKLKFVVEAASPLGAINPAASTALGVVKSVATIAVTLAAMDVEFAKQTGEMLEQMQYINDCDTFGQKTNEKNIHNALVLVYQKLLEFYRAAYNIVMRKGIKLVLRVMLEAERLPKIVEEFIDQIESLRKFIEMAAAEIVRDIQNMLYDTQISDWLGSESLKAQGLHHSELQTTRANEACDFLVNDARVIRWLTDESCQSLALIGTFVDWYKGIQQDCGIPDPAADVKWLKVYLEDTVKSLDRPLLFVVDALDECDRESRYMLVPFLITLASVNKQFKYLLSSRPQKDILGLLDGTDLLYLEPNSERDSVIVSKTIDAKLPYLSNNVKRMILDKLAPLAQGSGIWTKMVIGTIEASGIRAEARMKEFLKNIPLPSELSKLYRNMLACCISNNDENHALAHLALKFLAATQRNLSIMELTCAVTLGITPESATTVSEIETLMDWERVISIIQPFISEVDFKDLRKRQIRLVHQSVKEFIVGFGGGSSVLQPGENLVGQHFEPLERTILDLCIRYLLLDDMAAQPLFSESQAAIIELPQEADLFTEQAGESNYTVDCSWDEWEDGMSRFNPLERGFGEFFVYASCFWIEHLGHVSQEPFPVVADIERLCHAKSLRLDNWIQQNCRPGCAMQARYEFVSELYDPLSIVSLYGSGALLVHLLKTADLSSSHYLSNSPLAATEQVLQWGDLSRLVILFAHDDFKSQLHTLEFFRLLIRQWSLVGWSLVGFRHRNWDVAFDLVHQVFDAMVTGQWGNELLCISANTGCMPIIQRLMMGAKCNPELKAELWRAPCRGSSNATLQRAHQSVGEAALMNHIEVVQYLLEQDGVKEHLQHVNARGETLQHVTSKICNPAIVRLLADHLEVDKMY
ncbi:hypothetical protein MY3296_001059 [Beauveria thailandica]